MSPPQRDENAAVPTPLDLYSLRHLESLLGHTRFELADLGARAVRHYKPFPLKNGVRPFSHTNATPKKRWIDNPVDPLKAIQSRISERLLNRVVLPEHLLGGVKGKSISENAQRHLDAKYLVTIDIRNFFPAISPQQVYDAWRQTLNCSPDVAYLLTGLTTLRGRLPQGAPTSTLLANVVLSTFDPQIRPVCIAHDVTYSSWVDDLAFSGDAATRIVGPVIATLRKGGFSVSHQKINIMGPGERKLLNKLVIGRFVNVQKEYISRIRSGIFNLKSGRVAPSEVTGYVLSLEGKIGYLGLFDSRKAAKHREQLNLAQARVQDS